MVRGQPFSEREYLEMYPDVHDGVRAGSFRSGRHHYEAFGAAEGRLSRRPQGVEMVRGQPFSEREYLEMNPDVRAHVKAGDFRSGRHHYETFGAAEGRPGRRPPGIAATPFFGEQPVDLEALPGYQAEYFPAAGPFPWLDQPDWREQIAARVAQGKLSEAEAAACRQWAEEGYLILERGVAAELVDRAWAAYEAAIAAGTIQLKAEPISPDDRWPSRHLDPHSKVPEFCEILRHPGILRWVELLMEREPAPFQTITSHKGSQQAPHSDSIHMTTYPLGYLSAAWVAMEDIHPDSGPLVYYPGSHRLPYIFSKDVALDESKFGRKGYQAYAERYEPRIEQILAEHGCQPAYFHAKKGDVLLWHANLIHGGSPRRDVRHSRKAVVCHYFVKGVVTYHDLTGCAAHEHTGTCMVHGR